MGSSLPERVLTLPALWVQEAERRTAERSAEPLPLSDEEVLTLLKSQDRDALALLFERYSRLVFAIGFRILRDSGEAEDLVQSLFLYLWQCADLYEAERGSAKSWITQKAYSRALDRRDFLVRRQFYRGTDAENSPDTLAGDFDLEREIGSKLNREQLLKALGELPERQCLTLRLHFFAGLDLREISDRLGESIAQVRHHYYRGLDRLRKSALVLGLRDGMR